MPADIGMRSGWIFFDAHCVWCRIAARVFHPLLRFHGYHAVPLQTPGVAEWLRVSSEQLRAEMYLLTLDGQRLSGADAYLEIARARAWSRPLARLGSFPPILTLLRRIYAWVAARRPCSNGMCSLQRPPARKSATTLLENWAAWLPVIILPLVTGFVSASLALPPWVVMWALAFAIFAGCKWLTLQEARRDGVILSRPAALGYLLGWVGMEPREFAHRAAHLSPVLGRDWTPALARTLLGSVLVWLVVNRLMGISALAAGWAGMIGIILFLHFGLFDLLALAWRRAGYRVTPLMNGPTRAHSVGDFWGRRWNRGFNTLARRFLHRPMAAHFGGAAGVVMVFFVSGLIHDLVITVPAGGGYGLPTAYFLLQALALLLERSAFGRHLKLGQGVRGRLFALLVVAGPAFWLFPPVFVRHVILPMLHAIGAS